MGETGALVYYRSGAGDADVPDFGLYLAAGGVLDRGVDRFGQRWRVAVLDTDSHDDRLGVPKDDVVRLTNDTDGPVQRWRYRCLRGHTTSDPKNFH